MKIFIIIPTFNERENIEELIRCLLSYEYDINVVVVDDDSPDKTWQLVKNLSSNDTRIHLIHRKSDPGRGLSGVEGFKYALEHGAEKIIEMDADFSHDPVFLPDIIEASKKYDFVVGSRLIPGGADIDRSRIRKFLTRISNGYVRLMLRIPVNDCNSGYRCIDRKIFDKIHPDSIRAKGPAILQELLYRAYRMHFTISEVPIHFKDRKKGKSTLNLEKLLTGYISILKLKFCEILGRY